MQRKLCTFFWKRKRECLAQVELYKERKVGGWTLPDMVLFVYANYIKVVCQMVEENSVAGCFTHYFVGVSFKMMGCTQRPSNKPMGIVAASFFEKG